MKTLIAAMAALSGMVIAAPAMAAVSGSVGYSTMNVDPLDLAGVTARVSIDSDSWYGVEGEATIGTKGDTLATTPPIKFKLDSVIALYGVAKMNVNDNFSIRLRAGVNNVQLSGSAGAASASADGSNFTYGAGAQYMWGANGVRGDYVRYDSSDTDGWSVSFVHKFK